MWPSMSNKQKTDVPVTIPDMPSLKKLSPLIEQIWQSEQLTNNGMFQKKLERDLARKLGVKNISVVCNGTLALMLAIDSLGIEKGEIITTPFSFVASTSSILWTGNTPVFVDIKSNSVNIDPDKIEAAITKKTKAILAVHCYGIPCDVERIKEIADNYGLKIIYDGSHCFGVEMFGKNIWDYGDVSTLSFHATKSFNTIEGGAIISPSEEVAKRVRSTRNFGFDGAGNVSQIGLNAKLNEINAAIGILNLDGYNASREARKTINNRYIQNLKECHGLELLGKESSFVQNYSYFPVKVKKTFPMSRDQLYEHLKAKNIFARKYFYPLISDMQPYIQFQPKEKLANAKAMGNEVICLPIYPKLKLETVDYICEVIKSKNCQALCIFNKNCTKG